MKEEQALQPARKHPAKSTQRDDAFSHAVKDWEAREQQGLVFLEPYTPPTGAGSS